MKLNIENIHTLLSDQSNPNFKHVIGRALVALNERQTDTEQRRKTTINRNGRGFRPSHAYMGTSMAGFYEGRKHLTEKQIRYWIIPSQKVKGNQRDPNTGRPLKVSRISIYAGQLLKVAAIKKGLKECPHKYSLSDDNVIEQNFGKIQAWCKETGVKFFVNPEASPFIIYFADEGDKILCGLKWS